MSLCTMCKITHFARKMGGGGKKRSISSYDPQTISCHYGVKLASFWYWFLISTLSSLIQIKGFLLKINGITPAWSWGKSLPCLPLQPGLKPFFVTSKQCWCHCYIYRGLKCSVFQPGLWVNGMACLLIQTCFWNKFGMSPNTIWPLLQRKESIIWVKKCHIFSDKMSKFEKSVLSFAVLEYDTTCVGHVLLSYKNHFS